MQRLQIINNALMKCGLSPAADLGDCNWDADQIFDAAAEEILRSHAWNFSLRLATLIQDSITPPFGYRYSYSLPQDCVKVIDCRPGFDIRSPQARFMIAGKSLLTNVRPCNIRYVYRNLDCQSWPTDFADAVSCLIASRIASLYADRMQLVPQLLQLYQLALSMAVAADAKEHRETMPDDYSFILARAKGKNN